MPVACQSSPTVLRPCALICPVKWVAVGTVSCAETTGMEVAPWSGSMKKTAPSLDVMPDRSVQEAKSRPMELSAPGINAGPSMPIVRNESYSQSGATAKKAGLTGPMSVPKGAATW